MTTMKRTAAAIYALSAMRFVSPLIPNDLRPFKLLAEVIGAESHEDEYDLVAARAVVDDMLGRIRVAQVSLATREGLLLSAEHGLMAVRQVFEDDPEDSVALMHRDHARDIFQKALAG